MGCTTNYLIFVIANQPEKLIIMALYLICCMLQSINHFHYVIVCGIILKVTEKSRCLVSTLHGLWSKS